MGVGSMPGLECRMEVAGPQHLNLGHGRLPQPVSPMACNGAAGWAGRAWQVNAGKTSVLGMGRAQGAVSQTRPETVYGATAQPQGHPARALHNGLLPALELGMGPAAEGAQAGAEVIWSDPEALTPSAFGGGQGPAAQGKPHRLLAEVMSAAPHAQMLAYLCLAMELELRGGAMAAQPGDAARSGAQGM